MLYKNFCQSCCMPIDDTALQGTEKDGSPSREYCKYCYEHGKFINADISLDEMKVLVRSKMEEQKIPENIINMAVASLPTLKRWRQTVLIM